MMCLPLSNEVFDGLEGIRWGSPMAESQGKVGGASDGRVFVQHILNVRGLKIQCPLGGSWCCLG